MTDATDVPLQTHPENATIRGSVQRASLDHTGTLQHTQSTTRTVLGERSSPQRR
jgi:hypothetical protein